MNERIEKILENISNLSDKRGELIEELDKDLWVDEDHRWRARKYRELAEIEDRIAELGEEIDKMKKNKK